MTFVFRNTTLENILGISNIEYSGYGDISYFNISADQLVWFYEIPVSFDRIKLKFEIESWFNNIQLIYNSIPNGKTFLIVTLTNNFSPKFQSSDYSLESSIHSFNNSIISFAQGKPNVKIIDISEFTSRFNPEQLIDWRYYFMSKIQINPKLSNLFKTWFSRKIEEISFIRKKCIVLDLDNTLWGGILGEDGIAGIKIGGEYPGNAFLMFQEFLIELSKNGIIITICSKNNENDVLELWEKNPHIKLGKEFISSYRINWANKAQNIKEIAEELNIGLDSMVFIDDNPAERELIKQSLHQVVVPDFPEKPYLLPEFSKQLLDNYFSIYSVTEEDKKKTEQYKANSERANSQKFFVNFNDYIKSLEIEIAIDEANTFNITRIAQMTQKTNQFNLTTKRYTDSDIIEILNKGGKIYVLSVKDKFGDSGITGCIIVTKDETEWSIDSLLLSCRILGKGIETAFVKQILSLLKAEDINRVSATYLPTEKNIQVVDFYDKLGFTLWFEDAISRAKHYLLDLQKADLTIEKYYKIQHNLIDERTNI